MRIHYTGLAAIALLLGVCAFLSSDVARAGDEAGKVLPVQVYDIRIVRVVTPTPEGVEQPCPFLSGSNTTIPLGWPDTLAALKKRGTTTLLMDQRVTGARGTVAKASDERQVPFLMIQSKTEANGELRAAARLRSGCNVDLLYGDDGKLQYKVLIRGALTQIAKEATGPTETLTSWEGHYVPLEGRTLVLTNRQQQLDPGEANATGVELYCFITGRGASVR